MAVYEKSSWALLVRDHAIHSPTLRTAKRL